MKNKFILSSLILLLLIFIFVIVSGIATKRTGGPYYFKNFGDKSLPETMLDEITAEAAKKLDAYCVAYYDSKGRLITFIKYYHGEIEGTENYEYKDGKFVLHSTKGAIKE